jgi:hypothetical protein
MAWAVSFWRVCGKVFGLNLAWTLIKKFLGFLYFYSLYRVVCCSINSSLTFGGCWVRISTWTLSILIVFRKSGFWCTFSVYMQLLLVFPLLFNTNMCVCVYIYIYIYIYIYMLTMGACGSVVAKALCYKPEGRGFDTQWGEFLNLPNPSSRIRPWGLLSP